MNLRRLPETQALCLLGAATLTFSPVWAQSQAAPGQNQPPQSQPTQIQSQPAQGQGQQQPISNQAAVEATDGRYVPANGTIDGSSIKQFLNSGPDISATQMEEASIPADNLMQMPASVVNTHGGATRAELQEQREAGQQQQNPHKKKKPHGFFHALSQPMVSTLNFLGFPVGLNDDVGIDASLSSDLPETVRKRDGAYNPNVTPAVEATTNKYFGQ